MIIDLTKEMEDHLQRVKDLADEAADDSDQGFQSRAAAMTALTTMLVQITKAQEAITTMDHLTKVEHCIINTVRDYLSEAQLEEVINRLESELNLI